jgi:3-oxoadipate enol-lactonase
MQNNIYQHKEDKMNTTKTHDGINIAYNVIGEGEPLLLVNGQGQDYHSWEQVTPLLALRNRVILFDYRGTGESDKPQTPYSTELFAEDAIAVLDSLGIGKAHAFGISMGGRVCQWLGIRYQDRIGSLVLAATTPGNRHGIARSEEVTEILKSGNLEALGELAFSKEYIIRNKEHLIKYNNTSTPEFARRLHFLASENHDAWEFLPAIMCPTLILHGSDDLINPTENADILARVIPNSKKIIIDGGRHGFINEFKEQCVQIIHDFLRENSINQN